MPKQRKFTEKTRLLEKNQKHKSIELVEFNYSIFKIYGLFEYLAQNPDREIYLLLRESSPLGKFYVECMIQYQMQKGLPLFFPSQKLLFPNIPDNVKEQFSDELKAKIVKWEKLQIEAGKIKLPTNISYQQIDNRIGKILASEKRKPRDESKFKIILLIPLIIISIALIEAAGLLAISSNFGRLGYAKNQHQHIISNKTYTTTTTDSSSLVPTNPEKYVSRKNSFDKLLLAIIILSSMCLFYAVVMTIIKCYCIKSPDLHAKKLRNMLENNLEDQEEILQDKVPQNSNGTWGITRFSQLFSSKRAESAPPSSIELELRLEDDGILTS